MRQSIRAEIPDFELLSTMAKFLDSLEANKQGDAMIKRLAGFFKFPAEPKLIKNMLCGSSGSL